MKNALQGQLEEGVLANLLQYLSLNNATGSLQLRHVHGHMGEVFFHAGRVVHVVSGTQVDIMALSILLTWTEGEFSFRSGVAAPEKTIKLAVESLLLEASYQVDVNQLEQNRIDADTILLPRSLDKHNSVALSLRALHLLRHLDGKSSLVSVAEKLNVPLTEVLSTAEELLQQSLVDFSNTPTVSAKFMGELNQLVVDIMGPMAEIVIDDALYDLGLRADFLPEHSLSELLQEIRSQFKRDDWQRDFEMRAKRLCAHYNLVWQ
jgi:hypothetical protein